MRWTPGILCMVIGAACSADPGLRVTSDPSLPVDNLLGNPGFEEGVDGMPAHWAFSTARPDIFDAAWAEEAHSGTRSVRVAADSAEMSGYWGQGVEVVPGRYVFKGHFRLAAGRILIYAHGGSRNVDPPVEVNERFYAGAVRGHWLIPVFIPPEALTGPDATTYQPFRMVVDVPEGMTHLALSLGMYFEAGEVWFDDLWFGPAETTLKIVVDPANTEVLRLTVQSSLDEEPVYISPEEESPPGELALEDMAADAVYTVTAVLADGTTLRTVHPGQGVPP